MAVGSATVGLDALHRLALVMLPQVVYLPYEVSGMRGIIADLPGVFGCAADRHGRAPAPVSVLLRLSPCR